MKRLLCWFWIHDKPRNKIGYKHAYCFRCGQGKRQRVDEKRRLLRREVTILKETLHRKNVMLDALHYVWCDGGCGGGVHRYGHHGEITEEIVLAAESNTRRLRTWWINKQWHEKWSAMPGDERDKWLEEQKKNRIKTKRETDAAQA